MSLLFFLLLILYLYHQVGYFRFEMLIYVLILLFFGLGRFQIGPLRLDGSSLLEADLLVSDGSIIGCGVVVVEHMVAEAGNRTPGAK